MVRSQTLSKAIATRDRESESPDWRAGTCERCEREDVQVLATTAHDEFDRLCLVCCDAQAEDGDLTALVAEVAGRG